MNVRPLARLRALGILTGTWWLHQTMFPSGLCVVVGRLASRRGRLAARRGTIVLGIMGASSSAQAPSRPLESWTTARNARDKRR